MSYKALYRVYRPSTFNDIQDQEHITITLMNIIKNDKLSHAYLFSGPHGTGKTSIARIFAKTINCKFREQDVNPCDKCVSCKSANNGQTLDIIEMDAASNNGVAEIRTMKENIKFFPSESQYKIYIIDEVHMLSKGAFNALLKMLEEPPKHVIFILATTEPSKIPITILSRVQRFNFKQIKDQVIKMHLVNIFAKEDIKYEEGSIDVIVSLARGSLRDALSISDQAATYTNNNIKTEDLFNIFGVVSMNKKLQLLNYINESNLKTSLKILNNLISDGVDIRQLTEDMINIIKDYIVYGTTNKKSLLMVLNIKEVQFLKLNIPKFYIYLEILINLLNELYKSDVPEQNITLAILKMIKPMDNIPEHKETQEVITPTATMHTDEFSTKDLSLININNSSSDSDHEDILDDNVNNNVSDNESEDDNLENILNDFSHNKAIIDVEPSDNMPSIDKIEEEPSTTNNIDKSFNDDEIINLLVQYQSKEIELIKDKSKTLVQYLTEDSMREYVEWLTSSSLKLLSAGSNFILFATNDESLRDLINKKRRQKGFVKTIETVFGKDYSVYVLLIEQWYKIRDKYTELQKSNNLPKASLITKTIEQTDEERYGTELFGELFNSK